MKKLYSVICWKFHILSIFVVLSFGQHAGQNETSSGFNTQWTSGFPADFSNPFEPSMADPSSFVSSLTSLHLHLSEDSKNFTYNPDSSKSPRSFFGPIDSPSVGVESLGNGSFKDSFEVGLQPIDFEMDPDDNFFGSSFDFGDDHFHVRAGLEESSYENNETSSSLQDSQTSESKSPNFFLNPFSGQEPGFGKKTNPRNPVSELAASENSPGKVHSIQEARSEGYGAPVHETSGYGHESSGYESEGHGHESGGYGHESGGHESGGYGHESSGSGYGHETHAGGYSSHKSGYTPSRYPGPYGYPTPNFKCEYAKETLYVSKSEWTYDQKCFTIYKTQCKMEYEVGKDIGYKKECSEFSVTKCRTEYDTSSETKCKTVYRKECGQIYVTKVDWEYEEKCDTSYEEVCHGYGYEKKCDQVPKEHCHQVPVKVEKQVPKTQCNKVPDKKCTDFPVFIPRKACKDFPKTVCVKDPINVPVKIPKKVCYSVPKEVCNKIPVQIIKHVPKTVTKKVCTSTKPSGYGSSYSHQDEYSVHSDGYSHTVLTVIDPPNGNSTLANTKGETESEPEIYYDDVGETDYLDEVNSFNKSTN